MIFKIFFLKYCQTWYNFKFSISFIWPCNFISIKIFFQYVLCNLMISETKTLRIPINMDLLFIWFVFNSTSTRAWCVSLLWIILFQFFMFKFRQNISMITARCISSDDCLVLVTIFKIYLNIFENAWWIYDRAFYLIESLWGVGVHYFYDY